jgi:hypothetical protein
LLVKAVEEADRDGTLLPPADRAAAGREAMRSGRQVRADAARRARASPDGRITARHPVRWRDLATLAPVARLHALADRGPAASSAAVPCSDGSHRINVLVRFSLLGIVGWNSRWCTRPAWPWTCGARRGPDDLRSGLASARRRRRASVARSRAFNAPLARGDAAFAREWSAAKPPLQLPRRTRPAPRRRGGGRGARAGLYLRGIAFDYRAGWESTFLDAADVRAFWSRSTPGVVAHGHRGPRRRPSSRPRAGEGTRAACQPRAGST